MERIKKILLEKPKILQGNHKLKKKNRFFNGINLFVVLKNKDDQMFKTRRNTSNFLRRKMILERITDENREIFQRLDNTKTHYSNKFFQQNRKKTEVYLKAISKYPHSFHVLPSPKANNEEVKKNCYFIKILTKIE